MISGTGIVTWLAAQVRSPQDPGFWLTGSVFVAAAAANLVWLVLRVSGKRAWGVRAWPGTAPLAWLLVAFYVLLPPLAAWRIGATSPYFMGLAGLDWLDGLSAGGLLAGLIAILALAGWAVYRGALPPGWKPTEVWRAPLDAALWQWHWAFYRAAAIGWLAALSSGPSFINGAPSHTGGSEGISALVAQFVAALSGAYKGLAAPGNTLYWGAWLGLALIALEWVLNPFAREALRTPGLAEQSIRSAVLAAATTALFILTRNFWLCLGCHALVELLIAAWGPPRGLRRQRE